MSTKCMVKVGHKSSSMVASYKKLLWRVFCGAVVTWTATAQSLLPPPLPHPSRDENGVDVVSQSFLYTTKVVSIGPGDHHGLELNWSTCSEGCVQHNFVNWFEDSTYSRTMVIGNNTEVYDGNVAMDGDDMLKNGLAPTFDYEAASGDGWTVNYLSSLLHPDGVKVSYFYRQDGPWWNPVHRLQTVSTNTGWQLKFYYLTNTYDSNNPGAWTVLDKVVAINNVVERCDPVADGCTLSGTWPQVVFSSNGSDATITDAAGGQTVTSQPNWNTIQIKTPGSSGYNRSYSRSLIYDPASGVSVPKITQASIDGRVTNYAFSGASCSLTTVVASDAAGSKTYNSGCYGLFSLRRLSSFTNALNQTTNFGNDYYGRVSSITAPEQNSTSYVYDNNPSGGAMTNPRGNMTSAQASPKPGSGLMSLNESWTFPTCNSSNKKTCNKPSTYTDPKGAVTTYAYDDNHGGIIRETKPADDNGIQPVKRFTYAQRYAWYKQTVSGGITQADTPIYVLTEERTCLKTLTDGNGCQGGTSDEVVTTFDYGPTSNAANNLLVRGKVVTYQGESRRTCYGYDVYGNKISETLPRAGLSSCP